MSKKFFYLLILIFIILMPSIFIYGMNNSGDSSIYFTFFKNFFSKPFSYNPGKVTFGATSPIQVLIFSPFALINNDEILLYQILNTFLLALGLTFFIYGDNSIFKLCVLIPLTIANTAMMINVQQIYEIGIIYLFLGIIYYFLKNRKNTLAILVAGSLYLVRPELLCITISIDLFLLINNWDSKTETLKFILLSLFPLVIFHTYMFLETGTLLPSSVIARKLRSLEENISWWKAFKKTLVIFLYSKEYYIYVFGFASLLFQSYYCLMIKKDKTKIIIPFLFIIPITLLYIIFPPLTYINRYIIPIFPLLALMIPEFILSMVSYINNKFNGDIQKFCNRKIGVIIFLFFSLCIIIYTKSNFEIKPRYDIDTLLLKDLADKLNPIIEDNSKILIYEIQSQYHIDGHCISLDGIIGGEVIPVLLGEKSFNHFITEHEINYIVTMNSFDYRTIYNDTLLEDLYIFDLSSDVGDEIIVKNLKFTKIITNDVFSDPASYKLAIQNKLNSELSEIRVYGDWNEMWADASPMWNSVFKIEKLH